MVPSILFLSCFPSIVMLPSCPRAVRVQENRSTVAAYQREVGRLEAALRSARENLVSVGDWTLALLRLCMRVRVCVRVLIAWTYGALFPSFGSTQKITWTRGVHKYGQEWRKCFGFLCRCLTPCVWYPPPLACPYPGCTHPPSATRSGGRCPRQVTAVRGPGALQGPDRGSAAGVHLPGQRCEGDGHQRRTH